MKKAILGLTAAAAILAVSAVSFAATGTEQQTKGHGGPCGKMGPKMMNAQDKADFTEFEGKRIQLMKNNLAEDVQAGRISQEEADARIVLMQAHFNRMQKDGFNRTAPTDAEREIMKARHEKMLVLHKEFLQKQVSEGRITQADADKRISWMEKRAQENPGERGHGPRHDGMGPMGPMGGHGDCPPEE